MRCSSGLQGPLFSALPPIKDNGGLSGLKEIRPELGRLVGPACDGLPANSLTVAAVQSRVAIGSIALCGNARDLLGGKRHAAHGPRSSAYADIDAIHTYEGTETI